MQRTALRAAAEPPGSVVKPGRVSVVSLRIEEILEVVREAQSLHGEGHSYRPISELRRIAVETVARRRHVTSSTVADKFVRQLRPQVQGTADFDRLLEGHLQKSSPALRDILLAHATGQDDELRIIRTLTADATELSSRNRGTPTATTTHSSMHTPSSTFLPSRSRARTGKAEARLIEQCQVLARAIRLLAPLYREASLLPSQRQLIETTVGAAIWYLPQGSDLWTGRISTEALRAHHPSSSDRSPTLTKDHQHPRKVTAARLLSLDWTTVSDPAAELLTRYKQEYGTFNLVLKHENRRLMKYQRDGSFEDPTQAYASAGITLLDIGRDELAYVKRRDAATIERILARAG